MITLTENERNIFQLTGVGHFACHLSMLIFPTAAVALAKTENLPIETVLGWSFLGYFVFGIGALPVGLITDRTRANWIVKVSVLGVGPALIVVSFVQPGLMLMIALALVGLFASLYHPAGIGLISRTSTNRGTALGINGICGNLGVAVAPMLTQFCSDLWGWRVAYLYLGGFLFVLGLAVSLRSINEPSIDRKHKESQPFGPNKGILLFIILLIAMTLGGLSYRAMIVVLPAYFDDKVALLGHGTATTLVYLFGSIGQYFGGRLADRYDLCILYAVYHAISLPFVMSMMVLINGPLIGAAATFVFFNLGMQPIENSLVARFIPERWRSTGYGLKFTLAFAIGALSVRGVELITKHFSMAHVFLGIGGIVFLMFLTACLLVWKTRGQKF